MKHALFVLIVGLFLLVGCGEADSMLPTAVSDSDGKLSLPSVAPAALNGRLLNVVATTSLIGDVVAQVGGDAIRLTTLMAPGQDPHSYQATARALTAVADADIIFVNGWDLEEGLIANLQSAATAPLIPVSANLTPLPLGDTAPDPADDHEKGTADPHVWLDPANVGQWVSNIQVVLSQLDPANESVFAANATTYTQALTRLQQEIVAQIGTIPADNRKLVTNHDALAYFAAAYDFTIIGTVIPGGSTLAEPSARGLAELASLMRTEQVCTIFAEVTASDQLAQGLAAELDYCATVDIVALHTGALGPPDSGAESYLMMMQLNGTRIADALGNR